MATSGHRENTLINPINKRLSERQSTHAPRVRIADALDDLESIGRLRYRIYVHEMGKAYAQADHQQQLLIDEIDAFSTNLIVESDAEVIAAVRVTLAADAPSATDLCDRMHCALPVRRCIPKERLSFTSRLVVDRSFRGACGGRVLLPLLVAGYEVCAGSGHWANWIHARISVGPMFERLGFFKCGPRFWFEPGNSEHQGYVIQMDDQARFDLLQSPYSEPCRKHFPAGPRQEATAVFSEMFGSGRQQT